MGHKSLSNHHFSRDPAVASDIRRSIAERILPLSLHPYVRLARLDRPAGTWLLLLPCWWGLALAAGAHTNEWLYTLILGGFFVVGALAMRGAGCTYNDIVDSDIDGRVARTALRPIPSGETTVRQAWVFLAVQLTVGAVILFLLNPAAIIVGLCSIPVVAAYPFAKRFTHWPQAVLGLAFNWGVLVGYVALTGHGAIEMVLLYCAGVSWTLGYDTIYAHQDKDDDAIVGVKSTALLFGANTKPWLTGFYSLTLLLIATAGFLSGAGALFWAGLAACCAQLGWQVFALDIDDPDDCLRKFRSNRDFGLMVTAAFVVGWI